MFGTSEATPPSEATPRVLDTTTERLVRDLYPALRRFAAVAGAPESDPDDLVQEALLRTLKTRNLCELEYPEAYLRRSIVHLASNERRSTWRRANRVRRFVGSDGEGAADTYPSDLAPLTELSPVARAVVYMAEVEGATHREIAEALSISEANSRMVASRARTVLQKFIEEADQ